MWRKIFVIFRKEAVDNSRDRRSLLVALIYPLLGPLLLGLMISAIVDVVAVDDPGKATLVLSGAEYAPGFVHYLEGRGVQVRHAPADVEGAVRDGDFDTVVVIPKDYAAKFKAEQTAQITVVSTYGAAPADLRAAIDLIRFGRVRVGEMITHRLGLEEIAEGFRLVAEAGESIKVVIRP